jgi:hypothetical protein
MERAECPPHRGTSGLPRRGMHSATALSIDELLDLYVGLRSELDLAYARRPLDSARLDGLAHDLLRLEQTMTRRGVLDPDSVCLESSSARGAMPPRD